MQNGAITNQVRFNTIIAGKDPVAVDHVCARLVGINPDDVDHIYLAEKMGLGTNNAENIRVKGRGVDALKKRLRKNKDDMQLIFGRGNREWLLSIAYSATGISDPIHHEFIPDESDQEPSAGQTGWSADSVYFFDDRIDMGSYYNGASNVVAYAFTYFFMPSQKQAELWIGSDEAVIVYMNHKTVYSYTGTRTYDKLLSERIPITVQAGENALLVKTLQKYGSHDFALNICEVETDPEFVGNRVDGLKFHTGPSSATSVRIAQGTAPPSRIVLQENYPNPFNAGTILRFDLPETGRAAIAVYSLSGRVVRRFSEGVLSVGSHEIRWDGRNDGGSEAPTGVYLWVLETQYGKASKKLSLIR